MTDSRLRFFLIVTGKTEAGDLPTLLSPFRDTGLCTIEVKRKIDQRSPRTSPKRTLKVLGTEKLMPSKDQEAISLPVRSWLKGNPNARVVLVDDLEDRDPEGVFRRYREAIDLLLAPEERPRAAVHFLVKMIEAYFFAHPEAVEQALNRTIVVPPGDPEGIKHPKNELKRQLESFREIDDGAKIIAKLSLDLVLADPTTCAWLRSFAHWLHGSLARATDQSEALAYFEFERRFRLVDGALAALTSGQAVFDPLAM